jgi:uncharacterized membrane protein (UPF0127 family)
VNAVLLALPLQAASALAAPPTAPPAVLPVSAPGEVIPLQFGEVVLRAHVADTTAERNRGLMGVTELAADEGMVFVYPHARPLTFWMKDTPTPLSIAWCGADGRVLHVADMQPFDTTLVASGEAALYAIEARQGWFAAHGVAAGQAVIGLPGPSAE